MKWQLVTHGGGVEYYAALIAGKWILQFRAGNRRGRTGAALAADCCGCLTFVRCLPSAPANGGQASIAITLDAHTAIRQILRFNSMTLPALVSSSPALWAPAAIR